MYARWAVVTTTAPHRLHLAVCRMVRNPAPVGRHTCNRCPYPLAQALWQRYGGISPSLARQLCRGAGIDSTIHVTALTQPQWQGLHQQWQLWLGALETRRFQFHPEGDQGYHVWAAPPSCPGQS